MAVYIIDTFRVDFKTSSYYVLLIPAIGFLGRLIYSLIYKLCRENENSVSALGFAVCAAASLLLTIKCFGVFSATLFLSIIYAAVSVINTSVISIYPLRFSQSGNAASVCGIMDFATHIGAGISSAEYGVIIKHFGYLPMFIS